MNDLEKIRDEIITILVLIITLTFTSSNFSPESIDDKSGGKKLTFLSVINE